MKLFSTLTLTIKSLNHNILIVVCQPAWKECLTILLLLLCARVCFSEILICKMVVVPWLNYFYNSKNVIITYLYLKQYCIWGFLSSGMWVWFLTFWSIMVPSSSRITHWHTVISQKTWVLNNSFVRTSSLTVLYLMMISLTLMAYSF